MIDMIDMIFYGAISIFGLMWLYVATRMVARGILRSMEEWKEKKKDGYTK